MPSPTYDLGYLKAGTQILEHYLFSSEIYWTLGESAPAGEQPYPELTLGGLLLTRQRLTCAELEHNARQQFERLNLEFDQLSQRWRVAFGRKAANEFRARLSLWRDYLEDLRQQPENHVDRYGYEVQRRVMLDLLRRHNTDIPQAEQDLLDALDKLLKVILEPGTFVWAARCQTAFPSDTYWYLYGKPRVK